MKRVPGAKWQFRGVPPNIDHMLVPVPTQRVTHIEIGHGEEGRSGEEQR
jgi:hypothetical protein